MDTMGRYRLRKAAGMYWLLDMEQSGAKDAGVISFNECGAFIWEQFMALQSVEAVAEKLCSDFDIPYEECLRDVRDFLAQLKEQGVVI